MKELLIVNLHSAHNLGDDGIMAATLAGLERVFPDATITVAANDPESWHKYNRLQVTGSLCTWVADCRMGEWRWWLVRMPFALLLLMLSAVVYRLTHIHLLLGRHEMRRLLSAYYSADLVLSCGGGNFYAHHSPSPGFFWALMAIAFPLALGKPVAMLPQSVGPIAGCWQQRLARQVFRRVPLIMVRETRSAHFLREVLGVRRPVHVLPDLAFGLAGADTNRGLNAPPARAPQIGITVMDRAAQLKGFENQAAYERALVETLLALHESEGVVSQLFVQCYGPSPDQDDRPAAERVFRRIADAGIPVELRAHFDDAGTIRAAYAELDCLIATRMHTGIFALGAGVPTVMIAYQPKAKGVMAAFGLDAYCLDIATVTPAELHAVARRALANRLALRRHIQTRLENMQPELQQWQILLEEEAWRE